MFVFVAEFTKPTSESQIHERDDLLHQLNWIADHPVQEFRSADCT